MSEMVCNCSIENSDISNSDSESCDSSDSRQEQICLQDFATICISSRLYLGFCGPVQCWPFFFAYLLLHFSKRFILILLIS